MNRQNMYYPRYSSYGYPEYMSNFNTAYYSYPNSYYEYNSLYKYYSNQNTRTEDYNDFYNQNTTEKVTQNNLENNEKNKNTNEDQQETRNEPDTKKGFKFGPIDFSDNKISLFGFSLEIDDLILIGLIILLFVQSDCDYSLLIILGLMLFNISSSSLDFLNIFKWFWLFIILN